MKFQIKYDINKACKVIMQDSLEKLGIPFQINGIGEFEVFGVLTSLQFNELVDSIKKYGIEIISDPKNGIVQKIKHVIVEMVYLEEKLPNLNMSDYLAEKMKLSYGHISIIFSEITHTSISNFIILQRIEYAKQLIIENKLNLTEVACKLNYSSVAHLSNQFKKTTGLTPSAFQRILKKRKV